MTYEPHEFARVAKAVMVPSAIAWIVLLLEPRSTIEIAHCLSAESGSMLPWPKSFQMIVATNPPGSLLIGWAVMVVAMMSPVLIAPVCHIRLRSFTHRRSRAVSLFILAYLATWVALGSILLAIRLATTVFLPQSYLPLAGAAAITLVWQASPLKQRCLNGCHAHRELAAFGAEADFAALRFGFSHAIWCAGSCWALMLLPMLLPIGHFFGMVIMAVLVFGERLDEPSPPCWRFRSANRVMRIVVAQARLRQASRPASFSLVFGQKSIHG
jgi:predicted metal-binding membrane protein